MSNPRKQTFPGIRFWPVLGTYRGADQGWIRDDNVVDEQYAMYVGSKNERAYLDLDKGDGERYWFGGGRKIAWRDALVDEARAPRSREEARDPDWPNYRWNRPGEDVITEQLDRSTAIAERKAKLCVFVATTATSVSNPVPAWLMGRPGLTWTDGQGKDHVRLDKPDGYNAVADFLVALVRKYGDDRRVASITHGEVYPNEDGGGIPRGFDYDAFRSNVKPLWRQVVDAAPRDSRGDRVNLLQSQFITSGGFLTVEDIAELGVGLSGSVPHLFGDAAQDPERRALYGRIPTQHQTNTNHMGEPQTWDGTPNPWGFKRGERVPIRFEHILWYFGSEGPTPLPSIMMRDDSRYIDQWHQSMKAFGPNGVRRAEWGGTPHRPGS